MRWFLILTLLLPAPVFAQAARGSAKQEATKPQQAPVQPPPAAQPAPELPYDPDINRLAEVLGTLSFLRDLCGIKDGAVWRARMNDLMEAEGTSQERKERLAGSYNRGFYGYQITYRTCTPAARIAIDRLTDEGARLTRGITGRYGS